MPKTKCKRKLNKMIKEEEQGVKEYQKILIDEKKHIIRLKKLKKSWRKK